MSFNSLFEMHGRGELDEAPHALGHPFNSLFEMRAEPPTAPRVVPRRTFNSLFEMLFPLGKGKSPRL